MTYGLFEIPCESGGPVDIVWADPNATDRKAYTHQAYVIAVRNATQQKSCYEQLKWRVTIH